MISKLFAVKSLVPNSQVVIRDGEIEWLEPSIPPVTNAEIDAELIRLQTEYAANEYQRQRAAEYPDFREYLDGVVKGDQAQIQAYIDACNAVKAKYPKVGE